MISKIAGICAATAVAAICWLLFGGTVSADTGGYPYADKPCVHAPYKRQGSAAQWCPNYDWGDRRNDVSASNVISPFGYYYRNCTDYAAWRLAGMGVSPQQYKGLGNAKAWATPPAHKGLRVDGTPAVGSVGVRTTGTYGHVAVVEAVYADGTIRVSQYNRHADGAFTTATATPAALGLTRFVHFAVPQPPAPPAVVIEPAPPEPPVRTDAQPVVSAETPLPAPPAQSTTDVPMVPAPTAEPAPEGRLSEAPPQNLALPDAPLAKDTAAPDEASEPVELPAGIPMMALARVAAPPEALEPHDDTTGLLAAAADMSVPIADNPPASEDMPPDQYQYPAPVLPDAVSPAPDVPVALDSPPEPPTPAVLKSTGLAAVVVPYVWPQEALSVPFTRASTLADIPGPLPVTAAIALAVGVTAGSLYALRGYGAWWAAVARQWLRRL